MLQGKKILIGITGGIAAYKIPFLIRLLIKEGAEVKVLVTKEACNFVTPLTLSVLSQNPVHIEPFNSVDGSWHSHIEIGSWGDAFVIAPLTANTMAKMVTGVTDNLLLATYLASRSPVFIAPSMDVDMYNHTTTQHNINKLVEQGCHLIAPHAGELASGLVGMGRLEEPENIVKLLKEHFVRSQSFIGKTILISSGPTVEPIDPVRYISNHSTGKMGSALALEAAKRGAKIIFVSGPVNAYPEHSNIEIIKVGTASEMYEACTSHFYKADIAVMAAAVADYSPTEVSKAKIKKSELELSVQLSKTKDILLELGKLKTQNQILVGFALETDNEIENARKKLYTKNLNFIVLNSLNDKQTGFGFDTNKITVLSNAGAELHFDLKSKANVASDILDLIGS